MLDRESIRRVMQDRLRAEIAQQRADAAEDLPAFPWGDDLPIGAEGLGADSLARLTLAGAVNEMFHLHAAGVEDLLLARRRFGGWIDVVRRGLAAGVRRIGFRSSGSTGAPVLYRHDMDVLMAEAAGHAARLRPGRVLSAVPAHHIYGFVWSVLVPLAAGCPVADIRGGLPDDLNARDVIVSFPDHWDYIAKTRPVLPAAIGVTSTAPMPAGLAAGLLARGLGGLVEIYGSTETGGIARREAPDESFRLLPVWRFAEARDGDVRIEAADGRGCALPDIVAMTGPDAFTLRGRRDGAVQVGGINVYPGRVAAALERHPGVAAARVRPGAGRLKALIVPADPAGDGAGLRRELRAWMARELTVPERPGALTIAAALPTGAMGKDADWGDGM